MTRSLTTAIKNALATNDIRPVHLITIGFATPVNITDCSFPLTSSVSGSSVTYNASDFIKFAHDKIYMVVADVTADGSNEATITIEPPLITALANDSSVTYDSVPFKVHLTNDIQEFGVVDADSSGNLLYQFVLLIFFLMLI